MDTKSEEKRINWRKVFFSIVSAMTWIAIGIIIAPLFFRTLEVDSPSDFIKTEDLRLWEDSICISGNYTIAKISNTNSMDPVLDEDSLVLSKTITDYSEIHVGDIVTYKDGDTIIVHRIIGINRKLQLAFFKGDNNVNFDTLPVPFSALQNVIVAILY